MKTYFVGLACFVGGAIFGAWLVVKITVWVLNKLDEEGC